MWTRSSYRLDEDTSLRAQVASARSTSTYERLVSLSQIFEEVMGMMDIVSES